MEPPKLGADRSRSWQFLGLGLVLSAVLFYLAFRNVEFDKFAALIGRLNWFWIFAASVVAVSHGFVMSRKWQLVLDSFSKELTYWDCFWSIRLGNFFNAALPARLGEAVRLFFLKLKSKLSIGCSLGGMAADRSVDLVALVAIASYALISVNLESGVWNVYSAFGVVVLICVLLFFGAYLPIEKLLPYRALARVVEFFLNVQAGVRNLFQKKILFEVLVWTFIAWFIQIACLYTVSIAFGQPLSLEQLILVVAAVSLAVSLPSAPGHFGTFEFAGFFVLHQIFSLPAEISVSITLFYHLVQYFPTLLLGGMGLILHRRLVFSHWSEIKKLRNVS